MHDQAVIRITGEEIGDHLAEGTWKNPFIHVPYGPVHFFLSGGDTSLQVT
jgi:hypothetical protein